MQFRLRRSRENRLIPTRRVRLFGGAALVLAAAYPAAATANDGIRAPITVAQQQARQASDDAQRAAERQKKPSEQKQAIRAARTATLDAGKLANEHMALAKQAGEVQTSMATLNRASGTASAFCNAEDRGLKPLVISAQQKSELAERGAVAAAERTRRPIGQARSAQDRQALLEQLQQIGTGAARQNEISAKLQELAREIAGLRPCAPGAPDQRPRDRYSST